MLASAKESKARSYGSCSITFGYGMSQLRRGWTTSSPTRITLPDGLPKPTGATPLSSTLLSTWNVSHPLTPNETTTSPSPALCPTKKIDLIVDAFRAMPDRKLVIVGDGPERAKIFAKAAGASNISILGYRSDSEVIELMRGARAFVYCAEEDFGIVLVEAQACGTPVVAYGKGGAAETVVDGVTGVLYDAQVPEAIVDAIMRAEKIRFDTRTIRNKAERFSAARFRKEFSDFVRSVTNTRFPVASNASDDALDLQRKSSTPYGMEALPISTCTSSSKLPDRQSTD